MLNGRGVRIWEAFLLGLVGGAVLVLLQQKIHRACPSCQKRWLRIKRWFAHQRT